MSDREDLDQQLDLARCGLSSTPEARARVRERLAGRGAFSSPGTFTAPRPSALELSAPKLRTSRYRLPPLLSAVLMGVSFAAGYWLRDVQMAEPGTDPQRRVEPTPSALVASPPSPWQSASPAPSESNPEPRLAPAGPVAAAPGAAQPSPRVETSPARAVASRGLPGNSSPTERPPAPRRPAAVPARDTAATSTELALLRRVERAIRSGDPALALILLDQLERTYPASALGEERTAARVLIECARSGDVAKPAAARFLAKHPSSVYSDRIVRACQLRASRAAESSSDVRSSGH